MSAQGLKYVTHTKHIPKYERRSGVVRPGVVKRCFLFIWLVSWLVGWLVGVGFCLLGWFIWLVKKHMCTHVLSWWGRMGREMSKSKLGRSTFDFRLKNYSLLKPRRKKCEERDRKQRKSYLTCSLHHGWVSGGSSSSLPGESEGKPPINANPVENVNSSQNMRIPLFPEFFCFCVYSFSEISISK